MYFLFTHMVMESVPLMAGIPDEERLRKPGVYAYRYHNAGVYRFFLEPSAGSSNLLMLSPTESGDEALPSTSLAEDAKRESFNAYWLPWRPDDATVIELSDAADYFFTSGLAGCRLQVNRRDPFRPVVAHIAATQGIDNAPSDSAWRDVKAFEVLGSPAFELDNRISTTQGVWSSLYDPEGTSVVGTRDRDSNVWNFWVQQFDYQTNQMKRVTRWAPGISQMRTSGPDTERSGGPATGPAV